MSARKDTIEAVRKAAEAANDAKAADITALDVSEPVSLTEAFLIATGSSPRQVIAIAENVEKRLYLDCGLRPRDREGVQEGEWVLLDYGDFVVHIFGEKAREFYGLDNLWGDCPRIGMHLEHPETVHSGHPASAEGEAE